MCLLRFYESKPMDTLAYALETAFNIKSDGKIKEFCNQRYASFGKEFEEGKLDLVSLRDFALNEALLF